LRIKHIDFIRVTNPKIAEALDSVKQAIDNIALKTNVDSLGNQIAAPPIIGMLSVTAAGGVFDAVITDAGTISKDIIYFLEYSVNANFTQPHVIQLNSSRTWRGFLGSGTLFWRGYSQYRGSLPSAPVNFGAPTGVVGGGAIAGPAIQASTGSGTASNTGEQGGQGLGTSDTRINPSVNTL